MYLNDEREGASAHALAVVLMLELVEDLIKQPPTNSLNVVFFSVV